MPSPRAVSSARRSGPKLRGFTAVFCPGACASAPITSIGTDLIHGYITLSFEFPYNQPLMIFREEKVTINRSFPSVGQTLPRVSVHRRSVSLRSRAEPDLRRAFRLVLSARWRIPPVSLSALLEECEQRVARAARWER